MTPSVKDQLGHDWQKAQDVSHQRAARLRDIFKTASSEAFSELKSGSSEVQAVGRNALAKLIIYLKEQDLSGAATAPEQEVASDSAVILVEGEVADSTPVSDEAALPSWRQLFAELLELIRDRRTDWRQFLHLQFHRYTTKVEGDLTQEYGERYQRLKTQFKKAQAHVQKAQPKPETTATQVEVEVLEN